ncbi:MAG: biopolymer transporter ExbD [Rhodoferax sp.]|nr:biopolymer transporter ExbD [Rhodoferax sp.]
MSFGRLDRPSGSQPMSDINMTPLIDVMLVLVVIFILTAPLLASSIKLDLPRSDAAQTGDAPAAISIVVNAAGLTYLDDQAVSPQTLAQRLQAARQRAPDTELQLRADQAVPYGRIVEVMGIAQQAGLTRIAFVADNRSAPGGPAAKP